MLTALEKIDWEPALRNGNRMYDRMAQAARSKDRAQRLKEFDKIDEDLEHLKKGSADLTTLAKLLLKKGPPEKNIGETIADMMVRMLAPAVRKVQNAHDRLGQVHGNVQIAFALAAYHADHGRYPAKLEDLVPKYLSTVPDDRFSGKPLIYKPADKGYLFYSVGVDGKDQGGSGELPGGNLPVRMPVPELEPNK
jgi:hypothetical protein